MEMPFDKQSKTVNLDNISIQNDIHIKTEIKEDEFPFDEGTSYKMCYNNDVKVETDEPMIKIENNEVQDPLDINSEIKVEKNFDEHCQSRLHGENDDISEKNEEKEYLLPVDNGQPEGSGLNIQNQQLVKNESVCEVKKHNCKSELDRHKLAHTGEKPFTCFICKSSFTKTSSLTTHMRLHTGEKPYTCDVCKKDFRYKSYLTKHKMTHLGVEFQCEECDKSFVYKTSLEQHKKIHSGILPTCDICEKTFTLYSSFVKHKRIHTGEKKYSCDVCSRAFTQKTCLTLHKRLHTGEKPYSCSVCKKSFAQKSGFNHHKRKCKH